MLSRSAAVTAIGVTLAAAVVVCGCGAPSPDSAGWPAEPGTPPVVPATSRLVGVALPRALPVDGPQASAYTRFDQQLGTTTGIAHLFRTWDEPLAPPDLTDIAASGKYPLLSWNGDDIAAIGAGEEDDWIRDQAERLAATGVPTLIRFRWEMDRPNLRSTVGSPEAFVRAWRRVHTIFEQVGTPAISWVWCPTAAGFGPGGDAAEFYPGDDVVDWVCADAYPDRDLQPLSSLLTPFLAWAAAHDKPVMIGEFGVPRVADDDERAAWLDDATAWLATQQQVRAVVYFDLDVVATAPVLQFGVDPGTATASAFERLAGTLSSTGMS